MDLGTILILYIMLGFVISFIGKITVKNLLGILIVLLSFPILANLIIFLIKMGENPENASDFIPKIVDLFANNLPEIVIGEIGVVIGGAIGGAIATAISGGRQ